MAGYAYYLHNEPRFPSEDTTLRLAVAPVYLDAELGFSVNERTDWAIGLAGGGFADSYFEIRQGRLLNGESFLGHGGGPSVSLYHRFNPDHLIPVNGIVRLGTYYSVYERESDTAPLFVLPEDRLTAHLRTGIRVGGREPLMFPKLGMELSGWYEGQYRANNGTYGFNDRDVEDASHLFWGRALFIYTLPNIRHNFSVNLTGGSSVDADRFSAYRPGGVLPLASEFPLTLPWYFYKELSVTKFALLSGQYNFPLDRMNRWSVSTVGSVARLSYLSGFEQPSRWQSGVGAGLGYRSLKNNWRAMVGYSYGFDAVRDHGKGAQSIGFLLQWDLAPRRPDGVPSEPDSPEKSRGLFEIFGD